MPRITPATDLDRASPAAQTLAPGELDRLLRQHRIWLASRGAEGARLDLSETDLAGAQLAGADLRGAILRKADLSRADLSYARLAGADFTGANLSAASLRNVDAGRQNPDG